MKNIVLLFFAALLLIGCSKEENKAYQTTKSFTNALTDSITKASHYYPGFINLELVSVPDSFVIDESVSSKGDTSVVKGKCYLKDANGQYAPVDLEFDLLADENGRFQIVGSKGLVMASLSSLNRELAVKTGTYKEELSDSIMKTRVVALPFISAMVQRSARTDFSAKGSLKRSGNSTTSKIIVKNKSAVDIQNMTLTVQVTATSIDGLTENTQTSTVNVPSVPAGGEITVDGPSESDPNIEYTKIKVYGANVLDNSTKSKLMENHKFTGEEYDNWKKWNP